MLTLIRNTPSITSSMMHALERKPLVVAGPIEDEDDYYSDLEGDDELDDLDDDYEEDDDRGDEDEDREEEEEEEEEDLG